MTISYSEEPAATFTFSLKEKYRYWTRATLEEKSMFKVGVAQIAIAWGGGSGVNFALEHIIAFEKKIGYERRLSNVDRYVGLNRGGLAYNFSVGVAF